VCPTIFVAIYTFLGRYLGHLILFKAGANDNMSRLAESEYYISREFN